MASRKPVNRPSVKHPSHKHPLHIFKAQEEDEIICSGCELELTGEAFKCTKSDCDYFLHKSCFDLPREINHKSHPNHPLTLLHSPPYEGNSTYGCDACGQYGSSFIYHCSKCQYDVHVGCAFLPENVKREDHEHMLTLVFNSPCKGREGLVFMCDVCKETVSENLWVYHCKECDYGTHVHSCAVYENHEAKRRGEEEAVLEALRIESLRNARMELANMRISSKINNSVIHFGDEPRYHWVRK